MSVHDQIKAWAGDDDHKELSEAKKATSGEELEEVPEVNFTDPSNVARTAQEMIQLLKKVRPDIEPLEQPETGMSPEEIKHQRQEREAILKEMAAKITDVNRGKLSRDDRETAEEALENWDDALE